MTPPAGRESPGPVRRPRQFRLRSLMIAVAVAAVGLGALRVPGVGPFVVVLALAMGAVLIFLLIVLAGGLAALLAGMALAFVGLGLFALFDRLAAGARSPASRPVRSTAGGPDPEHARDP
jgi:hypothetical protein